MQEFKVNINDAVRVKLTEFGVEILRKRHEQLNEVLLRHGAKIEPFVLRLDDKGYYNTQLWMLMNIFGPYSNIGFPIIFDNGIIFETTE